MRKNIDLRFASIPGYTGYATNREGLVLGRFGRILKPAPCRWGYLKICAMVNGKKSDLYIHDAVCLAFYGEKPKGWQVCHLDGNQKNNRLENLRYGTPKENASHRGRGVERVRIRKSLDKGSRKNMNSLSRLKLNESSVRKICRLKQLGLPTRDISKAFSVSVLCAQKVISGETWRHVSRSGLELVQVDNIIDQMHI